MKKICVLLAILALAGCGSVLRKDETKAPGYLEPQSVAKFSDVPVPANFKFMPQVSFSFESSGLRVGMLKYTGKADIDQVVAFYKDQMPMYNWRFLNAVEYGERLLNFDREQETCIITLIPRGQEVDVSISLGPKTQAGKKIEKPLK